MLSFVVQNFRFVSPLNHRTRRLLLQNFILKSPIILNFFNFMVGTTQANYYQPTPLNLLQTFFTGIWQAPLKIFTRQVGLYTNNFSHSLAYANLIYLTRTKACTLYTYQNSYYCRKPLTLIYREPRIILQFALIKASLKLISFFFLQSLFYCYMSSNLEFKTYSNYILLSYWAYFYPSCNSFYFRIYHY